MEYINSKNPFENNPKKSAPAGLKTLCILTFIASGVLAINYFFLFATHDVMLEMFNSGIYDDILDIYNKVFKIDPEKFIQEFERLLSIHSFYFLLYSLVLVGSVIGAVFMLRLKIAGFHIYILSKIAAFSIDWFLLKTSFDIIPLVVAGIFIYLYFKYLKFMKLAEENPHVNSENDDESSEN